MARTATLLSVTALVILALLVIAWVVFVPPLDPNVFSDDWCLAGPLDCTPPP